MRSSRWLLPLSTAGFCQSPRGLGPPYTKFRLVAALFATTRSALAQQSIVGTTLSQRLAGASVQRLLAASIFALALGRALLAPDSARGQLTTCVNVTPGLRLTLQNQTPRGNLESTNRMGWNDRTVFVFRAEGTNAVRLALVPHRNPYLYRLFAANGAEMPLTESGKGNMVDVSREATIHDLQLRFYPVFSKTTYVTDGFRPKDYFLPSGPGPFRLEVRVRVWTKRPDGTSGIILSPPLRVLVNPPE